MSNPLKGFCFALGSTILLATNYVTAKYALKGFNPYMFSLVWTATASLYLLIIIVITGQARQLPVPSRHLKKFLLMGLATFGSMFLGWMALKRYDPSFIAFLSRFTPVFTILLGTIFIREKLLPKELIPLAIMVLGGAVSTMGRWHIVALGVALMLGADIFKAVELLIAKLLVKDKHPSMLTLYRCSIAALLFAVLTSATGKLEFDVHISYWVSIFIGAFLGPCAGHILLYRSYRYWELSRSSMVQITLPLFVIPIAFIAFYKFPGVKELVGGVIILAGAFWLFLIHRKTYNRAGSRIYSRNSSEIG